MSTLIPKLPEGASLFAVSDGDWIEGIFSDPEKAFDGKHRYVEAFNQEGKPLERFCYMHEGDLKSDPSFSGYTHNF